MEQEFDFSKKKREIRHSSRDSTRGPSLEPLSHSLDSFGAT